MDRRRLARDVGIGLEGEAQQRHTLARHRAEQPIHHQPGDALLLPGVQLHHALPVGRHLMQPVMAAKIDQIEDVLLEAATPRRNRGPP